MTPEEFRFQLRTIFFPIKSKNYDSGTKLNPNEEILLLDICNIVRIGEQNSEVDYQNAFDNNISPVVKAWLDRKNKKKGKGRSEASPLLLRQVLFYFCYMAYCNNNKDYQQWGLMDKLTGLGWRLQKTNVWDKWGMQPRKLYRVLHEPQVEQLIPYMGAKTKEKGLGIRYLAYQAGGYRDFIDVFGGSGFASISVIHSKGTRYFYNEKGIYVRNLFEVLSNHSLYTKYKKEMEYLREGLKGSTIKKGLFSGKDFVAEFSKTYHKAEKEERKEEVRGYQRFIDNIDFSSEEEEFAVSQIRNVLETAKNVSNITINDATVKAEDKNTAKYVIQEADRLEEIIEKKGIRTILFELVLFCDDYLIKTLRSDLKKVKGHTDTGENIGIVDYVHSVIKYHALGVWYYCRNLTSRTRREIKEADKVKYAVALTYLHFMAFNNGQDPTDNSEIMDLYTEKDEKKKSFKEFLSVDFSAKADAIHNIIKGGLVIGEDAIELVKWCGNLLDLRAGWNDNANILFYVDPPYPATEDYDKKNGIDEFNGKKREKLIDALINSNQKFIYSCRASISAKNKKDVNSVEKKLANRIIFQEEFEVFENKIKEKGEKLYVMAIMSGKSFEGKGEEDTLDAFRKYIRDDDGTEIYITNFRIRDYYSIQYNKYYMTMKYQDFMDAERNNLPQLSDKEWHEYKKGKKSKSK